MRRARCSKTTDMDGREIVSVLCFFNDKLPCRRRVASWISRSLRLLPRTAAPAAPSLQSASPAIGALPRHLRSSSGRLRLVLRPRFLAIALIVLAALGYGGRELYLRFTHIYEYDARVTADIVTVSSRADGWVVEMPALEGAHVAAGDIVVRIDDRVSKLRSNGLSAQMQSVQAERRRLRAEWRLTKEQIEALIHTRTSGVTVKEKALAAVRSDLDLSRTELERNRLLYEHRVANERQLQIAQAAVTKFESQLQQIQAEYEQAQGSLREAVAERDKLAVIEAQIDALEFRSPTCGAALTSSRSMSRTAPSAARCRR